MTDANTFLMSSGTASFKFTNHGDTAKGTIESLEMQQQRDIKDNKPLYWDDGNPKMQLKIVLATDERDPEKEDDDGRRAIFVRGEMQKAVREAIKNAGAEKIEEGGTLAVQYYADGTAPSVGMNKPKLYKAQYKPPSVTPAAVAVDDLL